MGFGLLYSYNSLPLFSIHSHFTPILNLRFSQILSDIILLSSHLSANSLYDICLFSVIIFTSFLYPLD